MCAKPKSVAGKFNEVDGGDQQENDPSHRCPSKNVIGAQPRIDPIAQRDKIFQAAEEEGWHEDQNDFGKTNRARQKIQNAITFRGEKGPLISFANNDRDGPKQNGQQREQQISADDRREQTFVAVPWEALAFVDGG